MNPDEAMPLAVNALDLRDYFAAAALAAGLTHAQEDGCILPPATAAGDAYRFADAMLAERSKT